MFYAADREWRSKSVTSCPLQGPQGPKGAKGSSVGIMKFTTFVRRDLLNIIVFYSRVLLVQKETAV